MEEARKKAYEKLINMSYKEFIKYVSLDVHGCKHKYE